MQDYNTIIGVIQMRQNECYHKVILKCYHIGSGTVQLILKEFHASGFTLEQLKKLEPSEVEMMFYPPENFQRKDIPLPEFQQYYDRIHAKYSKVNVSYCWLTIKKLTKKTDLITEDGLLHSDQTWPNALTES